MQLTNTQLNAKSIRINNEEISYIDSEHGDVTLMFIHGAFIDKGYWVDERHLPLSDDRESCRV